MKSTERSEEQPGGQEGTQFECNPAPRGDHIKWDRLLPPRSQRLLRRWRELRPPELDPLMQELRELSLATFVPHCRFPAELDACWKFQAGETMDGWEVRTLVRIVLENKIPIIFVRRGM